MKKQIQINDELVDIDVISQTASFVLFEMNGEQYSVNLNHTDDYKMNLSYDGQNKTVVVAAPFYVNNGREFAVSAYKKGRSKSKAVDHGQMISPMPGKILKVLVSEGSEVDAGTPVLIMEAMKMEHTIKANKKGKIEKILFKEGDQVQGGVELVKLC